MNKKLLFSLIGAIVATGAFGETTTKTIPTQSYVDDNFINKSDISSENANHFIITDGNDGITVSEQEIVEGLDGDVLPSGIPTSEAVMEYVDSKGPMVDSDNTIIVGDGNGGIASSGYDILDYDMTEVIQRERNGQIIYITVASTGVPTADAVYNYVENEALPTRQEYLTAKQKTLTYNGSTESFDVLVDWQDGGGDYYGVLSSSAPVGLDLSVHDDLLTALRSQRKGGLGIGDMIPTLAVTAEIMDAKQNKMTCTRWLDNAAETDENCLLWSLAN